MRKPEFITFTGIDERTDLDRVKTLSRRFPVEWGILFSAKNQGVVNRYPTHDAVVPLLSSRDLGKTLFLSAHICGRYSRDIMMDATIVELEYFLAGGFRRTQINVADGETSVSEREVRADRAAHFAARIRAERAIIQCRGDFPKATGVDWLYDRSGGAGVLPESWDAEAGKTDAFCGYAGGIGPDNVLDVLERIALTHPEDKPYWIDMEGRIRTDDWLDLDKCEAVLRAVYGGAA